MSIGDIGLPWVFGGVHYRPITSFATSAGACLHACHISGRSGIFPGECDHGNVLLDPRPAGRIRAADLHRHGRLKGNVVYEYPLNAVEALFVVWVRRLAPVVAAVVMGLMAGLSLAAG
ncbi:MAG: hypothetical protein J5J06_12080 [Phycisphaerae bacterium]|nr:hypothetical protein [Phycisphaerae bacterium]